MLWPHLTLICMVLFLLEKVRLVFFIVRDLHTSPGSRYKPSKFFFFFFFDSESLYLSKYDSSVFFEVRLYVILF